ncbi:5-formyltetrahydrofolate cyclo-ligase [Beijerinckia sp. L45]|uniref:5-formyltetrahydrofolate cyclo-ligase n=1 Tax=Beijerinckia sp. L45 TaxID=1641855 RepID=UPI00131AEBD6|nr:5-formyltetrahydrofolate cyclo-ligase [Beijerinckia sp. L45]
MTTLLDKPAMRAASLAARSAVTTEVAADFATRLADMGPALAREHNAKVVSAYWSIGDEILTLPLLEALAAAGFTVALPVTGRIGEPLVFRQWKPGDDMMIGRLNIPSPNPAEPVLMPDLLFVPLITFDRRGHRIGYGAGFYDRSLAALRAEKTVVAIGVGYAAQEVPSVPSEPHDQALDFVLTERELIASATEA